LRLSPWKSVLEGIQSILNEGQQGTGAQGGPSSPAGGASAGAGSAGGGTNGGGGSGSGAGAAIKIGSMHGSAIANQELGLVTVTARPAAMERIARYVASINARFAQNVMVDVKLYSVSIDRQSSVGFSSDLLYQRLNNLGASIVGSPTLTTSSGTPAGALTIAPADPASRWAASTLVAKALAQFGKVALQTQGQVIAVNGQPAPMQVASEINYLASSSTTLNANAGATTTLTPGTKIVGFTANFLPLILGDNRILLQYQMQISQLIALTQVSSAGATIQTPQISYQSLQQQAFVRDGQSIVLFSFDQGREQSNGALSIGSTSNTGESTRQLIVIVMQVSGGSKDGQI
jgi:type IVB pilus formation R64 PilN family outer membrane protein